MRYSLSIEQKNFFNKHGFIEFEDFLSDKQLACLLSPHPLRGGAEKRDLVRQGTNYKKIIYSSDFANVAAELTLHKRLRFGYDQLYTLPFIQEKSLSLQDMSCVRPLVCGLMIGLEGDSGQEANFFEEGHFSPFPVKAKNARFFLPMLNWDMCFTGRPQTCLLIAYAEMRSMYVFEARDPYNHSLKQLGYVFGDRLHEKHHPVVL